MTEDITMSQDGATPTQLPPPETIAADMVEAASRYRGQQKPRDYLGMSSVGDTCTRKVWYQFRGYQPSTMDGRLQMIFSLGSAVEEEVIKWLTLAGYKVSGRQDAFVDLNGYLRGHCDGVIEGVTAKPHVLEIKSASSARFKAFETSGIAQVSPIYAAQLQLYMGYAGLDRGLWVVMNKDNCKLYTERVTFDRDRFEWLRTHAAHDILLCNGLPPRGHERDDIECDFCDYRTRCWEGFAIQNRQTCGTCQHCMFTGEEAAPQARCFKHGMDIKKWGQGCPDWTFTPGTDEVPF